MVSSWTMLAWGRANATPRIIRVTRPTKVDASRSGWLVDRAGAVVGASGISVVVMAGVLGAGRPRHIWRQAAVDGSRDLVVAWSPQPPDRDADHVKSAGLLRAPSGHLDDLRGQLGRRTSIGVEPGHVRWRGGFQRESRLTTSPEGVVQAAARRRAERVSALPPRRLMSPLPSGGPASTAPGTPCPGCRLRSRHAGRRARRATTSAATRGLAHTRPSRRSEEMRPRHGGNVPISRRSDAEPIGNQGRCAGGSSA